jgi:hypothetical protein
MAPVAFCPSFGQGKILQNVINYIYRNYYEHWEYEIIIIWTITKYTFVLYKYGIVNVDRFSYTLVELREISLRPKLKRMAICKGTMEWNDRKKIMAMK